MSLPDGDSKKLDKFLNEVDEINDLIKNLSAEDESLRAGAIAEADKKIKKLTTPRNVPDRTGVNRTVINSDAYKSQQQPPKTDHEAFMKSLEQDANERAARRKISKAEATILKDEGNVHFKASDYQEAIDCYTKGLEKLKDFKELWTNRAQAYLKLEQYEKALSDCDWALRCHEQYAKAYVLQGKAQLGLQQYDLAIESFRKGIECEPKQESVIEGYIQDVELARNSAGQEAEAGKLFESGARHSGTLVEIMKKVCIPGELPLYYDGGVRVLADMLKDANCKTLFRTEGGLKYLTDHSYFSKIFMGGLSSLNKGELDSCSAMFLLLQRATENNEESQRQLIMNPEFPAIITKFLNPATLKKKKYIKESCLKLVLCLSQTETGRKHLLSQFDAKSLLTLLFDLIPLGGAIASNSFSIVNNLSLDNRLKKVLQGEIKPVLESFEKVLSSERHTVIPSCISTMTNLCGDDRIRRSMSTKESLLTHCLQYLAKHENSCTTDKTAHSATFAALGLVMNITLDKTEVVKSQACKLSVAVTKYLMMDSEPDLQERSAGILSHTLPLSPTAVERFISNRGAMKLVSLLSESLYERYTVKALTACTQHSKDVCKMIAGNSTAVKHLVNMLDNSHEMTLGNIALCLSHCAHEDTVLSIVDMEAMKKLLVHVREANNSIVKQNCAILIGKLAKGHPKHLEALRQLDGIGILHNSTKYYKL